MLALGGLTTLLSVGFAACANSPGTQTTSSESASQTAQSPMPGMDHGGMQMNQSPGSSMSGMDHSSMNMDLGPKDEAFDLRFIDAMIPHHEGAVEMAQEALQKSKRPEVQQLAQEIIDAQDKEIAQMKEWRKAWYPTMAETPMMYHAEMGHMMPMTEEMRNSMMMSGDLGAADDQFDLRFINAMIPHHQGAVEMANQAMEKTDRPEIKQLSQDIISSQQQEIAQMEQWRKQWYGQ
ncbi:MAG: DUF305 domain-containing protein [Pegethrix bostrychoides GSE-TBD4-15B]|uniref:DUF305 domain-containing protein n=1 Tax=Pegethrix bostrychoides GSE-TBD4-15B TaxID=2839662 RepID=A0A951PB02_9CYAN|nr:DUF305 domain-containing protein [Pegethrix bostrychoides GSE-TBD4-15B]